MPGWGRCAPRACAALLGLVLGLLATVPADASHADRSPYVDRRTTEATANLYRGNTAADWRHDVRAALAVAGLVRIQEAYPRMRAVLYSAARARPAWRITHVPVEVPIMWDRREWAKVDGPHVVLANPAGRWDARYLAWVVLRHRGTGRIVTVGNVHPDPGYCRSAASWAPLVARHWRRVSHWVTAQEADHPTRLILLGGDFNCPLSARARPYFPARVLAGFRFDRLGGVDHMVTERMRGAPTQLRRWAVPIRSDHRLEVRVLRWGP